jgi:hypothetical protein
MKLYFNFGMHFTEWMWEVYWKVYSIKDDDNAIGDLLEKMDRFNVKNLEDDIRLKFFEKILQIQTKLL